jgi:hypothetical protein
VRADLPDPGRPKRRLFGRKAKAKKAGGAKPDRETAQSIEKFVATRVGVEAYVEPQTATAPLSVVLVAADGEWIRKRIPDASFLQKLSKAGGLPVYDASLVGYPKRMREYRRPGRDPEA